MRSVRRVVRLLGRLVPARYTSRRDRMSPEQDQLALQYQFRSGI